MKKYLRAFICVSYSFLKFTLIKLFHFKKFNFSPLIVFSPLTEIDLGRKSYLSLAKLVKARSGVKLKIRDGARVEIGAGTSFNHGCMVVSHDKIIIGNNVQFGPNVFVYDHDHDFNTKNGLESLKFKTASVTIGNNVWIGANVVILRGTTIGNNCVIGAGTIVKGKFENDMLLTNSREIKCKNIKYMGEG